MSTIEFLVTVTEIDTVQKSYLVGFIEAAVSLNEFESWRLPVKFMNIGGYSNSAQQSWRLYVNVFVTKFILPVPPQW